MSQAGLWGLMALGTVLAPASGDVDLAKSAGPGSDAHWAVLIRGVPERLPVSRRQWPVVRQMLGL